jgi:thymidine kinase
MACAEFVTKVHAVCMRCGHIAHYSHRLGDAEKLVFLGEKESYEPLCRECFKAVKTKT